MSITENTKVQLALVIVLISGTIAIAFAAGAHIGNQSIHQDSVQKQQTIQGYLSRHAAQPHPGAITRDEYSNDLESIDKSLREIRGMVERLMIRGSNRSGG